MPMHLKLAEKLYKRRCRVTLEGTRCDLRQGHDGPHAAVRKTTYRTDGR